MKEITRMHENTIILHDFGVPMVDHVTLHATLADLD
jgi:hypothetical protein